MDSGLWFVRLACTCCSLTILSFFSLSRTNFVSALNGLVFQSVQSFSLPGTLLLCLIAGFVWGTVRATLLILLITIPTSILAYELDVAARLSLSGVRAIEDRVRTWRTVLSSAQTQQRLPKYIFWSRMAVLPWGWVVTATCASVGIPLRTFVYATVVGRVGWSAAYSTLGATLASWASTTYPHGVWVRLIVGLILLVLGPILQQSSSNEDRLYLAGSSEGLGYGATSSSSPARTPRTTRPKRSRRSSYGSVRSVLSTAPWGRDDSFTSTTSPSADPDQPTPRKSEPLPALDSGANWAPSSPSSTTSGTVGTSVGGRWGRPKSVRAPSPGALDDWTPTRDDVRPVHGHPPEHNPFDSDSDDGQGS